MADSIRLIGLPGSGKTRFKNAFQAAFPDVLIEEIPAQDALVSVSEPKRTWCLVDARSPVQDAQAQAWLKAMLHSATGLVFTFVEGADIVAQTQWQAWLKKVVPAFLPRYRWQPYADLTLWDWPVFDAPAILPAVDYAAPPLDTMCFELEAPMSFVNLEHLLFGLDTIKQNLEVRLWRVHGVVMTREYQHPVAIEGQIERWDTYAGELNGTGYVCVQGQSLSQQLLHEIIEASRQP